MTWLDTQDTAKVEGWLDTYRANRARISVAEYDGGDERFGLWMALVSQRLVRMVGIGLFDLADWNIRDAYDSGSSPREAAIEALSNDDLYAELVDQMEAGL